MTRLVILQFTLQKSDYHIILKYKIMFNLFSHNFGSVSSLRSWLTSWISLDVIFSWRCEKYTYIYSFFCQYSDWTSLFVYFQKKTSYDIHELSFSIVLFLTNPIWLIIQNFHDGLLQHDLDCLIVSFRECHDRWLRVIHDFRQLVLMLL